MLGWIPPRSNLSICPGKGFRPHPRIVLDSCGAWESRRGKTGVRHWLTGRPLSRSIVARVALLETIGVFHMDRGQGTELSMGESNCAGVGMETFVRRGSLCRVPVATQYLKK